MPELFLGDLFRSHDFIRFFKQNIGETPTGGLVSFNVKLECLAMPRFFTVHTIKPVVESSRRFSHADCHCLNRAGWAEDVSVHSHCSSADSAKGIQVQTGVWECSIRMAVQRLPLAQLRRLAFHRGLHRHGENATASFATVLNISRLVGVVGGSVSSACLDGKKTS